MSYSFWFQAPLSCLSCGSAIDGRKTELHTRGLNPQVEDVEVVPGDTLAVDGLGDFDDGYFRLSEPSGTQVQALEQWGCPVCGKGQWARLDFERLAEDRYRFVSARTVPLTPEVLREMHFFSRLMDLWVEANPGRETDAVLEVIGSKMNV